MKRLVICLTLAFMMLSTPVIADDITREVPQTHEVVVTSFAPLVKKAAPAVVNIYTRKKVIEHVSPFFSDPFFKQFMVPGFEGGLRQRVENSLGSGVIVRPNGLIITNYHVIKDGDAITVILADKREFQAKVLLKDEKVDLALLKIDVDDEKLPYLQLEDSDTIEVGDLVLAIGNPFGVGQTVTSGIISALARSSVGVSDFQSFIQTDAAINPGNSGGALVTMNGRLVGVNTAIYSSSGGSVGIGFAIPSNMVATILANVSNGEVKSGHVIRPWLGAETQTVTPEIAQSLNLKAPSGVLVNSVYPDGPADSAGIRIGDIITAINHHATDDDAALRFRIATSLIGKSQPIDVLRDGKPVSLTMTMDAPPSTPAPDTRHLHGRHPLSGATVANLSPALASELDISASQKGVVVMSVKLDDYAGHLGVMRGDIVKTINGIVIDNTRQLEKMIGEQHGWNMAIQRGRKLLTVRIE